MRKNFPFRFWIGSGRPPTGFSAILLLLASLVLSSAGRGSEEGSAGPCDEACRDQRRGALLGDWYVLTHVTDAKQGRDAEIEWDDQVWRIELAGENLRWTIFPHVELKRSRGRYREYPDGLLSRSLGRWEPDAQQRDEIRAGLEADPYGSRSKILRGSVSQGWGSAGTLRSGSASLLGYHELWRIDLRDTGPVFKRQDSMGSGRTDVLEDHTILTSETVEPTGDEIFGQYERGERFRGHFRMMRMGDRRELGPAT